MNQQTASSTSATDASGNPSAEGRVFVLISIAIVAVMFVGMVGLLYWRERPAPSALLVIRVPMAQDGAIATIDTADGRDLSPVVEMLKGGQEVRIPLPPGEYTVKIEHPSKRIKAACVLTDYSYFPLVIDDHPATRPATRGSSKR